MRRPGRPASAAEQADERAVLPHPGGRDPSTKGGFSGDAAVRVRGGGWLEAPERSLRRRSCADGA